MSDIYDRLMDGDELPPAREYIVRLTAEEAETAVNGLRWSAHHQDAEGYAPTTPLPDSDPWPDDMSAVADKIALAVLEALEGDE
jgi:hypothetical protein